jgi:2,5-diamino-6-(ribosylamino)-4(3H)-pyrimidinone 5'-phosphate reductase
MARSTTSQRPSVTLVGAMSIDGKISTRTGESQISSPRDLRRLHQERSRHSAVMIGVGTLLHDNPLLTVRHIKGKSPIRIIVDSSAKTPPNARIFSAGSPPVIVAVTSRASKRRVEGLRQVGANIIQAGTKQVNLRILLTRLHQLGIKSILLEGGGTLNWSMLSNQLVDHVKLTVAPFMVGGSKATTLVDGKGFAKIDQAISFIPVSVKRQNEEIVITYKAK